MCYSKQARPPLPPPHILASLVPDSPAFVDLMQVEQKLDWTLLRKKAEINDALGRPVRVSYRLDTPQPVLRIPLENLIPVLNSVQVKRNLRIFISNTTHDQTWQNELSNAEKANANPGSPSKQGDAKDQNGKEVEMDVTTGKGIPGWVMRIEGRLLDVSFSFPRSFTRSFLS